MTINNQDIIKISIRNFKDENGIYRYKRSLETQREVFINNVLQSELVILGDSTIEYTELSDEKSDSIASMLTKKLKSRVYSCSGGSFSFLLWRHIFQTAFENTKVGNRLRHALENKMYLLTLNMRSFSDEWYLRPSYNYEYIKTILKDEIEINDFVREYFSDNLLQKTLSYYNALLDQDRNFILNNRLVSLLPSPAPKQKLLINDVYSYFKANPLDYKTQSMFYYGYKLDVSRILDLKKLVTMINELGSTIVCYVTPLNLCRMNEDTKKQCLHNITLLNSELSSCSVLNYYDAVDDDQYYFDKEHLKFKGRRILSDKIYDDIHNYLIPANTQLTCYRGFLFKQIDPPTFRARAKIFRGIEQH